MVNLMRCISAFKGFKAATTRMLPMALPLGTWRNAMALIVFVPSGPSRRNSLHQPFSQWSLSGPFSRSLYSNVAPVMGSVTALAWKMGSFGSSLVGVKMAND